MPVVDDQAVVRAGFAAIIDAEPDLSVADEAGAGASAVAPVAELRPDVVLMDIGMPGMDGLTATRSITGGEDGPRVPVLTTFDRDVHVFEALRAGASGFLLKDARAPAVTRRLIAAFAHGAPGRPETDGALERLTPREREVLFPIAWGRTNAEIGERLGVSVGTVETHVNALLRKLDHGR
ncbi:response regulator transcription factor [Streptomyces macrosporus]|uniref:Response regulator transcription factor n=1 Tax=Streptomyces macrosporus TaxID=44032 RepID=A0ABN3K5E2_9ACTN